MRPYPDPLPERRPIGPNDAFRFALEISALVALGYAGWRLVDSALVSIVLAVLFPLVAAVTWAVFRVDGDPGPAPVPVPGLVRLSIESDVFAAAVILLALVGEVTPAIAFAVLVTFHYALAYRRVRWLLRHPGRMPGLRE